MLTGFSHPTQKPKYIPVNACIYIHMQRKVRLPWLALSGSNHSVGWFFFNHQFYLPAQRAPSAAAAGA